MSGLGKHFVRPTGRTARTLREAIREAIVSLPQSLGAGARRESGFWALRDVTFDVEEGEVIGIVGRNGAGKSTLLKILARITAPTEGRASIAGRVGTLLEVGTGFHSELTGRENVYLSGAVLGMRRSEIRSRFDQIIDYSGVGPFIDTPVKHYSSGMHMRLAFSVAAHLEPDVLIIDEVLAVGDAEFQRKCLGTMQAVAHAGRTVLFVSHNMAAVRALCTRGIVLDAGRVVFDGPADQSVGAYEQLVSDESGRQWRVADTITEPIGIEEVDAAICGVQPGLELVVRVRTRSTAEHRPAFMALDIVDGLGTPLMQAIPSLEPFIPSASGRSSWEVRVQLPPLVPGIYRLSAWIGPHFTQTYDLTPAGASFEVTESALPGRAFPHTTDHGFVTPRSTVRRIE